MATIGALLALHVLAAMFWVGGMAFAYTILRPAAGPLDAPARLALWRRVFASFLPWVGVSIVVLLITGYTMVFLVFGGFKSLPLYVNLMQSIGIVMMLLYLHLTFAPWKRLKAALDRGDVPAAGGQLGQIRKIVAINLALGVLVILIAVSGRYW
ncbi:MAG: CopD family protein [Pseudolabrys sp.]|nr:CopD family protein [Pseudolabrys sp.]MCW5682869.1 CopD family protein [Pseudolabrys sp.]